jgi:peptidoglycan/LPS O-acetylase OafA/YrhL
VGPLLGGLLTAQWGWRSIFFATLPLGVVAVALIVWRLKGEWAEARGERFDLVGSAIYGLALIALMYGASLLPDLPGLALVGVGAAALLVSCAKAPDGLVARAFATRPLVAVGRSSYSLYLIHAPLLQLEWQYVLNPLQLGKLATYLLLIGVGIPVIVAVTYVFHLFCERPFMSVKQRRASEGEFADLPETRRPVSEEPVPVPVLGTAPAR